MSIRATLILPLALLIGCGPASSPDIGPEPPAPGAVPPEGADRPYLVMVSFDGMAHYLLDRVPTPAFDRVARQGARADGLIPSYPTKTFPNHYTLATGLYPAHHGIVDNSFYDPELDLTYRLGDPGTVRDQRWYDGEPIWVTAEEQGVRSASFFWVGSEAPVQGRHPTYYKYYDGDFPYEARVDTVLHWLSLPLEERPQLVTLYFSEPDHTLHAEGPASPAVDRVVERMDGLVERLLDGLQRLPIADSIHLVLVSDHGMAPAPVDQVIYLDDHVDLEDVRVVNNTTQTFLYFDGDEERLQSVERALQRGLRHATVYRRDETPERWRYRDNDRIGDLVVSADLGWVIRLRDWRPWTGGGMHGWDPRFESMHGIFMAMGPRVPQGVTIPAFENIHVYPFLAELLGLEPAPVDGRLDVLAPLLERQPVAP